MRTGVHRQKHPLRCRRLRRPGKEIERTRRHEPAPRETIIRCLEVGPKQTRPNIFPSDQRGFGHVGIHRDAVSGLLPGSPPGDAEARACELTMEMDRLVTTAVETAIAVAVWATIGPTPARKRPTEMQAHARR